ncbi:MAG: iron-containing alcohol dehydrogenase [Oscillospiraceae bacterium]
MEAFNFYTPTRIIGGQGAVRERASLFEGFGSHAFIVTGAGSAKASGALDDVLYALGQCGISCDIYDKIGPNPLALICAQGGEAARQCGASFIIGIGGGSALDAARAVSVYAANDFASPDEIFKGEFTQALPLVTVGTTAGTGSEVDAASILTSDVNGQKQSIRKDFLFAKLAFCDYRYTKSMSLRQTVSTGLDALCHCLESWFHKGSSETSRTFSRRGAQLLYPRLEEIASGKYDLDDDGLRADLYHGSLWGGFSLTGAGAGFPHPAGYPLTEMGIFPHGVACAVFEKEFVQFSMKHCDPLWREQLLDVVGTEEKLYNTLDVLTHNNLTLSSSICDGIAHRFLDTKNARSALGTITEAEALRIVRELFLSCGQTTDCNGGWEYGR